MHQAYDDDLEPSYSLYATVGPWSDNAYNFVVCTRVVKLLQLSSLRPHRIRSASRSMETRKLTDSLPFDAVSGKPSVPQNISSHSVVMSDKGVNPESFPYVTVPEY